MSAISKDVMVKAEAVYDALGRGSETDTGIIARAIMAERKRAAEMVAAKRAQAEKFRDGAMMGQNESWSAQGAISACKDIERTILSEVGES